MLLLVVSYLLTRVLSVRTPLTVGYAKVPSKTPLAPVCTDEGVNPAMAYAALAKLGGATAVPLEEQISSGNLENFRSPMALTLAANGLNGVGPHSAIDLQQSLQPVAGLSPRAVATEIASAVTSQSGVPMPSVSEQQVLLRDLTGDPNDPDAESPLVVGELGQAWLAGLGKGWKRHQTRLTLYLQMGLRRRRTTRRYHLLWRSISRTGCATLTHRGCETSENGSKHTRRKFRRLRSMPCRVSSWTILFP